MIDRPIRTAVRKVAAKPQPLSEKRISNNMIRYGPYRNHWFNDAEDVRAAVERLKKSISEEFARSPSNQEVMVKRMNKLIDEVFGK